MDVPNYVLKLGNALNELRKQDQLCDVTINIGGRAFHVHKAVLAAFSGYFMAMFTSGFSESTQSEINIDGDADIFEMVMEFTYTGKMKITAKTAYDVLEMACYMQFTELCVTCCEFIGNCYRYHPYYHSISTTCIADDKITIGDVYKIAKLASCHDIHRHLKQLAQKSVNYLCSNLKLLKCSDVFLQLGDMNFLNSFLERQFLSSKDEEKEVLEMVVNWIKHDWSNRCTYAITLLQKVRLGFVPGETLKTLLDASILEIPECNQLLEEVLNLQKSNHSSVTLAQDFPHLFATRSTVKAPVISTSLDDGDKCRFYYYNWKDKEWDFLANFDCLPHLASLIVVNERLYAVGGIIRARHIDSELEDGDYDDEVYDFHRNLWRMCNRKILSYDAEKNEWKRLPSSMKRACHSSLLVHMDGFIYAIGGLDKEEDSYGYMCGQRYMDRVERYDMEKMEWQDVASLPKGFTWKSAVVFQDNILVYGVEVRHKLKHVLVVYNSNTNTWASKLFEQHDSKDLWQPQPTAALFVHEDVCYRVLYQGAANTAKASVNMMMFSKSRRNVTVKVGEAIQQNQIPENKIGAFRIRDEVFMNIYSSIHKTDLKINADQSIDLDLDKWRGPIQMYGLWCGLRCSNGVSLSVDIKRLSTSLGLTYVR